MAIRYRLDDPDDIYMLEVLGGFPGGDDDELLNVEFEPSANLLILGRLHLALGSPAQVLAAITRGDADVDDVKNGKVEYDDGSSEAASVLAALGL